MAIANSPRKTEDDMLTAHCRVGVQHKMSMPECAKINPAGDEEANEAADNESGEGD
jgi:hypothetical protein